jgi:hypothetical protein
MARPADEFLRAVNGEVPEELLQMQRRALDWVRGWCWSNAA